MSALSHTGLQRAAPQAEPDPAWLVHWKRWKYPLQFAAVTGLLLTFAILMFLLVQMELFGGWVLDQPGSMVLTREEMPTVGLVGSHVRRMFSPREAEIMLGDWELFLDGMGVETVEVALDIDGEFEQLADGEEIKIILIPTPQGMTPTERLGIQAAMERGVGALISVSSSMVADEGILLADPFWRQLLNLREARVHTFEQTHFLPFVADTPFDHGLPAGSGLVMEPGMKLVSLHTYDQDEEVLQQVGTPDRVDVRWGSQDNGRWVFLGFDPSGVPPESISREAASQVLISAFAWLKRQPLWELQHWPGGHDVAATVAIDMGDHGMPSAGLVAELDRMQLPVSWFVGLPEFPEDGPPIANYGTSGLSRGLMPERDLDEQRSELFEARRQHRLGFDSTDLPLGLLPPGELYDSNTLRAMASEGFGYLYAAPISRRIAPELVWARPPGWFQSRQPIVLVPRTSEDDLGLYLKLASAEPAALARWYRRAFARERSLGGLFSLTLHPDFLDSPGMADALLNIADGFQEDEGIWLTTVEEVADWWRRREQILVTVEREMPHRLVVRLSNVADEPIQDVRVKIYLPERTDTAAARLAHWRTLEPEAVRLAHRPGSDEATLALSELEAGASEMLYLEWN